MHKCVKLHNLKLKAIIKKRTIIVWIQILIQWIYYNYYSFNPVKVCICVLGHSMLSTPFLRYCSLAVCYIHFIWCEQESLFLTFTARIPSNPFPFKLSFAVNLCRASALLYFTASWDRLWPFEAMQANLGFIVTRIKTIHYWAVADADKRATFLKALASIRLNYNNLFDICLSWEHMNGISK